MIRQDAVEHLVSRCDDVEIAGRDHAACIDARRRTADQDRAW
jgi:hypothetical protein